ncbi:hypothetical protein ACLX1H_008157 [Fusarium chlamydosporum]
MHDNDPVQNLGLTCPYGSTFYVCENDPDRFIGCCAVNPCGVRKGLCPDQYLQEASFDESYEGYIPPQACINDNVDVAWHACSWSMASFMGCCAVDPCSRRGCPSRELRAAKLSDNSENAEVFLGQDSWYSSQPGPTASPSLYPATSSSIGPTTALSSFLTSITAELTPVTDTSTKTTTSLIPESHGHPNRRGCLSYGQVIGVVFGIITFIAFGLLCYYWNYRSKLNREKGKDSDEQTREPTPKLSIDDLASGYDDGSPVSGEIPRHGMDQARNHNGLLPVQQMFQPDTSHHNDLNHSYGPAQDQNQDIAAEHQSPQAQAFRRFRNRSLTPEDARTPSPNHRIPRKPTPGPIASLQRRIPPPPVPPHNPVPPTTSRNPETESSNGSAKTYVPPGHGNLTITNGIASNRSSETSKISSAMSSTARGSDNSRLTAPLRLDPGLHVTRTGNRASDPGVRRERLDEEQRRRSKV